jgi:hypothetical protein
MAMALLATAEQFSRWLVYGQVITLGTFLRIQSVSGTVPPQPIDEVQDSTRSFQYSSWHGSAELKVLMAVKWEDREQWYRCFRRRGLVGRLV